VPFFLSWKGKIEAGQTFDQPVIQLDLHQTARAAAGVSVPSDARRDGVNLLPFINRESRGRVPHDALFWRFGAQMAVRKGDWKLVRYDPVADGGKGRATEAKLYNLANDLGEMTDVAMKEPDRVKELQALWDDWNKGNVAPLWGGGKKN
jgi:arylsulfatase A-like enzyme